MTTVVNYLIIIIIEENFGPLFLRDRDFSFIQGPRETYNKQTGRFPEFGLVS